MVYINVLVKDDNGDFRANFFYKFKLGQNTVEA